MLTLFMVRRFVRAAMFELRIKKSLLNSFEYKKGNQIELYTLFDCLESDARNMFCLVHTKTC